MSREKELLEALEQALEYIDAIPKDAAEAFPAMPGFDRDKVDELIYAVRHSVPSTTAEQVWLVADARKLMDRLYDVLGAAAADCLEVASKRLATQSGDAFGNQAAERADIIRELVGDARYIDNPLRQVIDFAESKSA